MLRLSDIQIGTKLIIISAASMILVAGMLASTLYGNSQVSASNATAMVQLTIARDVTLISEDFLRVRLNTRNVRLATSAEELRVANTLAAQQSDIDKTIDNLASR